MGSVSPGGFDVVVHLAESVINRGLALIPNGTTFPIRQRNNVTLTALAVPLPLGGGTRDVSILYDAFLEADRPQVTLNQSDKTVSIHCNLTPASQLTFLRTVNAADAALLTGVIPQIGLGGSIELDGCTISVENVSGIFGTMPAAGSAAVAHAGGVSATIALVVPTADAMNNVTLASSAVTNTKFITVMTSDIQSALATAFGAVFGNAIGDLPLTNPVLLNAGTMPVQMVKRIDAAISPTGSPAAISLGVLTAVTPPSPGGTIPAPPADLGPEIGAVLGVANYWTLQLVCSALTGRHPGMKFTIDQSVPSASFSGGVTVPGGDQPITIRKLDITAGSGGLAIVGHATASADCWDASIDFDFDFTFTCNPATGAIMAMVPNEPHVNVSTDTSLFCEIVGAVLGTIVGILVGALVGAVIGGSIAGIPGVIAGGIIGGVVGGVSGFFAAGALIDPLDNTGVSLEEIDVLAGLTLPLPVGGAGFLAQSCSFDDFVAAGNLVFFDLAERHRSGSVQFAPGSGFDLDAGVVRASLDGVSDDPADLFWSGSQLQVLPGAHTGPQFDSRSDAFDTLSLTDLEGFTYGTTAVPLGAFNLRSRLGATVTFAARTDEGRFAKCRARRDLSGRCNLDYIVYERPPVCLSTVITIDTLSQRVTDKGTDTCTEVHDVVPFNPFLDIRPLAPSAVATAILQRPAPQLAAAQNVVHFPDLQDLFDRGGIVHGGGVIDPGFVFHPPKPCGTHTTVENRQVPWQIVERRQQITLEALPVGLRPPITYEWEVFGTMLTGSGTKTIDSVDVAFQENSPILTLTAKRGVDVAGSIVVHATDADGIHASTTRHVNSPSSIRVGGCCQCNFGKLTLASAAVQLAQAQVAQRVYDAGIARLRRVAAGGQVKEVQSVTLVEAAAQIKRKPRPAAKRRARR